MTAREAMAYGRPVVATRVGGLADLRAGVVFVEPQAQTSLSDVLRSHLGDFARRTQLGEEGRRAAIASFGEDAAARILMAAYQAQLLTQM